MAYGSFKSVAEVARKFDIAVIDGQSFIHTKILDVPDILLTMIADNLKDNANYVSEYAVCDALIRPVLDIVAKHYPLRVWSHIPYHVDVEKGLIGEPDYLIAPMNKYGEMAKPALCVIEAKKDNFDEGWAQALAEMVASNILGASTCYGMVTTGSVWQYGKLAEGVFSIDSQLLSAPSDLQGLFNTINWLFNEISE